MEQAGERAVGEDLAAALAARAVVRLAVRVDDALDLRAADRAGLAEAAVHGHALAKRGDLLGEPVAGLGPKPVRPLAQHVDGRRVETVGRLAVEFLRERDGR